MFFFVSDFAVTQEFLKWKCWHFPNRI